jgi:hypothetical protein
MSSKFAFTSTFAAILLLNCLTAGAVTQSLAKEPKKNDKKSEVVGIVSTQQRSVEKKKDDGKKKEVTIASGFYQPALMKPASLRHHRHHRYSYNA